MRGAPQPAAPPAAVWINPPKPPIAVPGETIDVVGAPQSHDLGPGGGCGYPRDRRADHHLDAAAATLTSKRDRLIIRLFVTLSA